MSVVLISPPILFRKDKPYMPEHELFGTHKYELYPSLELLYLTSALEEKGIPVRIVDAIAPPKGTAKLLKNLM